MHQKENCNWCQNQAEHTIQLKDGEILFLFRGFNLWINSSKNMYTFGKNTLFKTILL